MSETPPPAIDHGYYQFARTDRELETLKLFNEVGGNANEVGRRLNCSGSTIRKTKMRIFERASKQGYSPENGMDATYPETFFLERATIQRDSSGAVIQRWDKIKARHQRLLEGLRVFAESLADELRGKFEPVSPPKQLMQEDDLLTAYRVGDAHLGLYAWEEECGENYDTDKAVEDIASGSSFLIQSAPPTRVGLLISLGDTTHGNDRKNATPMSGNILDVDTRHSLVMRKAAKIIRTIGGQMLTRHQKVRILVARGNHDPDAAIALRLILEAYFEREDRVEVVSNDPKVLWWQWGDVVGFVHHGEVKRQQQYNDITRHYREQIGTSKFVYVDNGHIHHKQREEIGAAIFESWNTLTPRDAYHADNCYGASRSITSVCYHKRFGEVSRNTCSINMIRELQGE